MNQQIMGLITAIALFTGCVADHAPSVNCPQVHWDINNLNNVGGYIPVILGEPVSTDSALEFDGIDDGLIVPANPLMGCERFTIEVVFRPDPAERKAQRFVHVQEDGSENRVMIETRLTDEGRWFLDTFIKSGTTNQTLQSEPTHELGKWYSAALVFDGKVMRHYVNGAEESSAPIEFQPLKTGEVSIGMRHNRIQWFRGAIREVRFTAKALPPAEMLMPQSLPE